MCFAAVRSDSGCKQVTCTAGFLLPAGVKDARSLGSGVGNACPPWAVPQPWPRRREGGRDRVFPPAGVQGLGATAFAPPGTHVSDVQEE